MGIPMTTPDETAQAAAQAEYEAAAKAGMERDDAVAYIAYDALGSVLVAEFNRAEMERRETEERWLKDLRQYRGIYDPDILAAIGPRRSKAFVRSTRVKVKTVDARVADLLFPSNSDRNWTAEPTPLASVDNETRETIEKGLAAQLQRAPDQKEFEDAVAKAAKKAADKMTDIIDDQLTESHYKQTARFVLHSGHLYGTGVLKAPLVERKTRTKFVMVQGKWTMITESYVLPFVDYVPIWRFYPDMSATRIEDCRYIYERHLMTRSALASLGKKRSFNGDKIRDYILAHPKGMQHHRAFDTEIRQIGDRNSSSSADDGQYEILERWGWLDGELLANAGVNVPQARMHETFFGNVWLLPNGDVLKVALQPLNGVTWPYHLYYADKDETSIFGDGFAAIMRDDQTMINAGTRMILDNAALTAGPQLEANMKLLSPSERAEDMYPFKIWKRNGDEPTAPAIRVLDIPNGLEELFPLVNMFKENADEVTAIPRYMQGENATNGAAGTASGMSMLMANASIVMKDLITNYDEGITRPFIESLYYWNMQFNPDDSCKGDFAIKARGTASLMAKEIRSQQLDQFASTLSPEDAPYIKREELLRQRAEAHDLTSIIKTEEEVAADQNNDMAKQQAQMAQQLQALQMQTAQLQVEKLTAEIAKMNADAQQINAAAIKTNVDAAYAAMQAGGVATERPQIAPAGDAILKSAGYVDKTPPPAPGAAPGVGDAAPAGTADPGADPQAAMASAAGPATGAAVDPAAAPAVAQVVASPPDPALPDPAQAPAAAPPPSAEPEPQSGQAGANVGEEHGIETARID